jgi:hypothetical protein
VSANNDSKRAYKNSLKLKFLKPPKQIHLLDSLFTSKELNHHTKPLLLLAGNTRALVHDRPTDKDGIIVHRYRAAAALLLLLFSSIIIIIIVVVFEKRKKKSGDENKRKMRHVEGVHLAKRGRFGPKSSRRGGPNDGYSADFTTDGREKRGRESVVFRGEFSGGSGDGEFRARDGGFDSRYVVVVMMTRRTSLDGFEFEMLWEDILSKRARERRRFLSRFLSHTCTLFFRFRVRFNASIINT